MLIEAPYNFTVAYIGGTFDGSVTLFQLTTSQTYIGVWSALVAYAASQAVTASDGNVYVASQSTTNNDPVTDAGVHWDLATPYDLTDYEVSMVIENAENPITLTSASGGGLTVTGASGAISVHATPSQTGGVPAGGPHYYLALAASTGVWSASTFIPDVYFPMSGTVTFSEP